MQQRKRVLLRSVPLSCSGYGTHARQISRYLLGLHDAGDIELFIQPLNWGMTPWLLDRDAHDGLVGRIIDRCIDSSGKADVQIALQLPNEWDPSLATVNIGMSAVVETDRCSPSWVSACDAMDLVIVPSSHARTTLLSSGETKTKIVVIPESFPDAVTRESWKDCSARFDALAETQSNFLVFGQMTPDQSADRKNTLAALRTLFMVLEGNKDVGVVLKTNFVRNTCTDREDVWTMLRAFIIAERRGQFPRVHLIHGSMADDEIVALLKHRTIAGLLSLTHGEGFCLPMLEAAACDVSVIAPAWSGYMDFMGLGSFVRINHSLVEVPRARVDEKIFINGAMWAEPDIDDAVSKLKRFLQKPFMPKEWAMALGSTIRERFSFDAVSRAYSDTIGQLLVDRSMKIDDG